MVIYIKPCIAAKVSAITISLNSDDDDDGDEISAGAIIQAKYRVCWGPHQTRNDTNYRIETLYTRDVTRETRPTAHRSHFRHQMEMEMVLQAHDRGSRTSPLTMRSTILLLMCTLITLRKFRASGTRSKSRSNSPSPSIRFRILSFLPALTSAIILLQEDE